MFKRKQLCPNCKTGKEAMTIDPRVPQCPYIQFHNGKRCKLYVRLNDPPLLAFLKKIIAKF